MQVSTINIENYKSLQEFTKKKIIWGRKSDKIKNDLDYETILLDKIKKDKIKLLNNKNINLIEEHHKINLFDKQNKFEKFDSVNIKNNRRI